MCVCVCVCVYIQRRLSLEYEVCTLGSITNLCKWRAKEKSILVMMSCWGCVWRGRPRGRHGQAVSTISWIRDMAVCVGDGRVDAILDFRVCLEE